MIQFIQSFGGILPAVNPLTPVLSVALEAATVEDRDRLAAGLRQVSADDAGTRVEVDERTGETTIAATGVVQLEAILDRLRGEFGVDARVGRPQILYRETPTMVADGSARHVAQAAGRGEYGHVALRVHPAEPASGIVVEHAIFGDAIPHRFMPSIEEGVRSALQRGVLAGFPVDGVRVEVYDGSYHDVDSSELAFRIAAATAAANAMKKAVPALLEPIMRVEVVVPLAEADSVTSDLIDRGGSIESREYRDGLWMVSALAPLSRLLDYAFHLRLQSHSSATCAMRPDHYRRAAQPPGDPAALVREPRPIAPGDKSSSAAVPEP